MATKPWFERAGWEGQPGLHALIVGISEYPHLPLSKEHLQPTHFGMLQLSSPALTAFRLAQLLKERADHFDPPLATCRLLLSASPDEVAVEAALGGFGEAPDYDNFSEVAKAWRTDACQHQQGRTLFYLAGHGIQRVKRDHVLVLHNFGSGKGATFSNKGINVDHLIDGMAASPGQENIARSQLYFFDTCRVEPDVLKEYEGMEVGNFWDFKVVPKDDDRVRPTFFASKPGGAGFATAGAETIFGGALLKCLRGGAGRPRDKTDLEGEWVVSLKSLSDALLSHIDVANREAGGAQVPSVQNLDEELVLLRLEQRPEVKVLLELLPGAAAAFARVSVVDLYDHAIQDLVPFAPNPYEVTVPAGVLVVRAVVDPERPPLRPLVKKSFFILPPEAPCKLPLSPK